MIGSILYRVEREEHKQLQYLKIGELAVRFFTDSMTLLCILMLFITVEMLFMPGIIVCKKLLEFDDNMSIFVHDQRELYCLPVNIDIAIIIELS